MKFVIISRMKMRKYHIRNLRAKVLISLVAWALLGCISWKISEAIGRIFLPPPMKQDLSHFRRSRSLKHYLDNIQLLIEPSSLPCSNVEEVPVLVIVTSAPNRIDHRLAIRNTWGPHFPTYFILGLDGENNDQLIDNYVEAKQYGDMVVLDFRDHYQNLTLKVGLMMQWALDRCPQAQFLYKNDDDVLVNPWILKQVLKERSDAKILGYAQNYSWLHRDEHNKWYLPRWLCSEDVIPQYITGPGYLISGEYIRKIFETAKAIPLHNIEDIYFTYHVAKKTLRLGLSHDDRLSPYRPTLPLSCAYWQYASVHSLTPIEILKIWSQISIIGSEFAQGIQVCQFYTKYLNG